MSSSPHPTNGHTESHEGRLTRNDGENHWLATHRSETLSPWRILPSSLSQQPKQRAVWASVVSEFVRCSTGGTLAGIRIEGQARARYVDLGGEGSENDQVLLSIQEAARRFGMSTSTIRRWIETGRLEAFFESRATGVSTSLLIRLWMQISPHHWGVVKGGARAERGNTRKSVLPKRFESRLEDELSHDLLPLPTRVATWVLRKPSLRVSVLRALGTIELSVSVDAAPVILRHRATDVALQGLVLVNADFLRDERWDYVLSAGNDVRQCDRPQDRRLRAEQLAHKSCRLIEVAPERPKISRVARLGFTRSGSKPLVPRAKIGSSDPDEHDLRLFNNVLRRLEGSYLREQLTAGLPIHSEIGHMHLEPEFLSKETRVAPHPSEARTVALPGCIGVSEGDDIPAGRLRRVGRLRSRRVGPAARWHQ